MRPGLPPRGADRASAEFTGSAARIPDGHVHILGDNLHSSVDSRSLGRRPEADVLGEVAAVIRKP